MISTSMAKKNILFFICSIVVIFSIQAQQEFQEQIDKLDYGMQETLQTADMR